MTKHQKIEKIIGTKISNKRLLRQAFTHPSHFGNKKATHSQYYQRLEFLGDAVLNLAVASYIYGKHTKTDEGKMTKIRSALVKKNMLATVFDDLNLLEFINFNEQFLHKRSAGRTYLALKADIIEALIAVIYKDKGLKGAEKFIEKYVLKYLPKILKKKLYENPINLLQEKIVKACRKNPRYKLLKTQNETFFFGVYLGRKCLGKGSGASKKDASMNAAHKACAYLKKHPDLLG